MRGLSGAKADGSIINKGGIMGEPPREEKATGQ